MAKRVAALVTLLWVVFIFTGDTVRLGLNSPADKIPWAIFTGIIFFVVTYVFFWLIETAFGSSKK